MWGGLGLLQMHQLSLEGLGVSPSLHSPQREEVLPLSSLLYTRLLTQKVSQGHTLIPPLRKIRVTPVFSWRPPSPGHRGQLCGLKGLAAIP